MNEDLAMALGGGAMQGMQQADTKKGFFNWLSGNYGQVTDSVRDIACLFKPETCAGGYAGQPPVIVQQEDPGAKNYFLILGVLILLVLVVLLVKK